MIVGILQESCCLWTHHGIDGKERAKEHDIVRVYLWINKFQLVVWVILVEDIVGIVVFVKESQ